MNGELIPLNCNHLEQVVRISDGAFAVRWSRQDFAYFLGHEAGYCFGLKQADGELTAYLIGLIISGELDIISIATSPTNRRQGFAEALLRQAQWDPQVNQITLEVDVTNLPAVKLYQKLGFQISGTRKGYYQQKQDAYRMLWRNGNG